MMIRFFEHFKRSFAKAITYRILIIISTFCISFFVTGEVEVSIQITSVATIINTLIYIIHERIWNRVHWGKTK